MLTLFALALLAADPQPAFFGFPADARVLHESAELRVAIASDDEHLYVQAVLFNDGDDTPGETADGRAIGDHSSLLIDADADGEATIDLDRSYSLSPWPRLAGLHYSVVLGPRSSTGLKGDSKGRGHISYVELEDGRKVRIDSYLVPLEEIGRKAGETVRIAYWGSSTVPELVVNSVGFEREGKYYSHHLPRERWHEVKLVAGSRIDVQEVPEGRGTIEVPAAKAQPKVGEVPPPIIAADWINWKGDGAPTLENLKGKVVAVEFWATWCGPCIAGIPHLNELHEKYGKEGMVLLSVTDQSKAHVEEFMATREMNYTVGTGSGMSKEYGVRGIPQAFVIGRDGKVAWAGHPALPEFEEALRRELARKSQ